MENTLFLTCPRGIEDVCRKELIDLGILNVESKPGGVAFKGDISDIYKIIYFIRTGMHLLLVLKKFECEKDHQLYNAIYDIEWNYYISAVQTFSISSHLRNSSFRNSLFVTHKAKDAIVDRIRKEVGARPNIDSKNPDIPLTLIIDGNNATLYMNTSGDPLYKRGYRQKIHKASVNEVMAAGILKLMEWNESEPLYDPMCGSGTFIIEAAMMSHKIPAGLYRKKYAFQNYLNYNPELWTKIKEEFDQNISKSKNNTLYGSDKLFDNVELSKENAVFAGVDKFVKFQKSNFKYFKPRNQSGKIIINPPYGERIGGSDNLEKLYEMIGDVFKSNCKDIDAYIFAENNELIKHIGLKSAAKIPLKNGKIDCRLIHYPIYEGSRDE